MTATGDAGRGRMIPVQPFTHSTPAANARNFGVA